MSKKNLYVSVSAWLSQAVMYPDLRDLASWAIEQPVAIQPHRFIFLYKYKYTGININLN